MTKLIKNLALQVPIIKDRYIELQKLRNLHRQHLDQEITLSSQNTLQIDLKNKGYSESLPSVQNALNIFEGKWFTQINQIDGTETNKSLFDDARIRQLNEQCSVKGKNILELGPHELGHAYMLEKMGVASVTSIEAGSLHYLKCLIIKDIYKLNVKLLHGDFREYLKVCNTQ